MVASLRALLSGIIDYAGLFPPAGLPLDQAVRDYLRYRQEPESWMLARFICPATQLGDLGPYAAAFPAGHTLDVSALAGGGADPVEFSRNLARDQGAVQHFQELHKGRVTADVQEVRLPADIGDLPWSALRTMQAETGAAVFCEATTRGNPQVIPQLARALKEQLPASGIAGVKLRTGGLEAAAFPSCEQVAFVVAACRDAAVPLKFTAGLHHPIRHYNAGVKTYMHGFLNIFVAGVLAHARGLGEAQLRPVIEDEDPAHFAFDEGGLRWRDCRATTEEIRAARKLVTSFGSCSFDEPRDDLRALGWLP